MIDNELEFEAKAAKYVASKAGVGVDGHPDLLALPPAQRRYLVKRKAIRRARQLGMFDLEAAAKSG